MQIAEFQKELFAQGKEMGFTDMEIYYSESKSTSVNVQDRAIKNYVIAEQGGVAFRGNYNGNIGYSYTENLDASSLDFLLREALNNAEILEAEDREELFDGAESYAEIKPVSQAVKNATAEELIKAAFTLENAALGADPLIARVIQCKAAKAEGMTLLANTKGLFCQAEYAYISAGVYLMAQNGAETTTGGEFDFTVSDFEEIKLDVISQKAAAEAVKQLGATSIASGNYPVVLHYETAGTLLGYFVATFGIKRRRGNNPWH